MAERVAIGPPVFPDAGEGLLLDQDADAGVLLVQAAFEQPAVDLLADVRARIDDLAPARAGMLLQIGHEPQFERVHASDVAAIGQ